MMRYILSAILAIATIGAPLDRESIAEDQDPNQPGLSLLVIDISGWRSSGVSDRVTDAIPDLAPDATVISIGIQENLPDQHPPYDLILSVRDPDLRAARQQISDRVAQAASGSRRVILHIDINEEALPQQLRELFGVQLLGANETRGPGQLAAALLNACGANHADRVIVRGHSDGTWVEGYLLDAMQRMGLSPTAVILESPRERWAVWKARFEAFPQTFFLGTTAKGDAPRDGVLDVGFGRANEVRTKNYASVDLNDWAGNVNPHSAPTAYATLVKQARFRGPVGEEMVDCCVHDLTLGKIVLANIAKSANFGEFAQQLAAGGQHAVVRLEGFPQTGDERARQIAQAGLIAVRPATADPSATTGTALVIRELGNQELSASGNRGFLPGRDSPTSEVRQANVAKVFVGDNVLECPSGDDSAAAVADHLAEAQGELGALGSVPVWSTTRDFPGPDVALLTDFARQRLDSPGLEGQAILVVGNDDKSDRMVHNLAASGVVVIRVRAELSLAEAETLGRQSGAAAVLRVGEPPMIAVQVSGDTAASTTREDRPVSGEGEYAVEQVADSRWHTVRKGDDPPADSVWIYDGEGVPASAIADAVEKKAEELGLPTGAGNNTKVVVGGDPADPKYAETLRLLRDMGFDVIEEHWAEGTLTKKQKIARVAKRAHEVGAKLGAVDGYTLSGDGDGDSQDPPPMPPDDEDLRQMTIPPVAPPEVPPMPRFPVPTPAPAFPPGPPPFGQFPGAIAAAESATVFRSRPLTVGVPLSTGLRSNSFLAAVGGIAFDAIAVPANAQQVEEMTLTYDADRPDGSRLCVTVDGHSSCVHDLPDWQLVPIARFADSPYYAIVTLFGELENPQAYVPGTNFIVAFHPAFEDTLLGLRLWQADLPFDTTNAELPRFDGRCVLASGEQPPDCQMAVPACRVLAELYGRSGVSSYLICDARRSVTFTIESAGLGDASRVDVQGEPYFHYWSPGPATMEQVLDATSGRRVVRRSNGVVPASGISEQVASHADLLERANPAVYHALVNTMRYAAFFRYIRHRDGEMWRAFLKALDAVPESTYRFPTPVLMVRQLDVAGHVQLGQRRLASGHAHYAIAEFTEAIKRDPTCVVAYEQRGDAYRVIGNIDQAIADCDTALRLQPNSAFAVGTRGAAYLAKGDHAKAIEDLSASLEREPTYLFAHTTRARLYQSEGKYDEALVDWSHSLECAPNDPATLDHAAWFLATCPDERIRAGARAIELARRACELTQWTEWSCLDTLAAACAECGDFEQAVTWESRAIRLATTSEQKQSGLHRRSLYEAGKPWREP